MLAQIAAGVRYIGTVLFFFFVFVKQKTAFFFFFQAEDGIRDRSPSRGLGDVYKRQILHNYASDYEQSFLDASQEFLSKNYTDDPAKWGMMDAKVWDNYTDFMKENGLIKEKVSAKELFTNQFIAVSYTHLTLPTKRIV